MGKTIFITLIVAVSISVIAGLVQYQVIKKLESKEQ